METKTLDELIPASTAGDLPSSRTFDQLEEAMLSDDILSVKSQLLHIWVHYQALECVLSDEQMNAANIRKTVESLGIDPTGENVIDLIARVYANAVVLAGYESAHLVGEVMRGTGGSLEAAMQMVFSSLDFTPSDPTEAGARADSAEGEAAE